MDRRKLILSRLFVVLQGSITSLAAASWHRNRGDLDLDQRPGGILLDADETAVISMSERKPSAMASPNLVSMSPEVYYVPSDKKPKNTDIGDLVNDTRTSIVKAVLIDEELRELVSTNGTVRYDGLVSDLAKGRDMAGELGIGFTFIYPLIPSEL